MERRLGRRTQTEVMESEADGEPRGIIMEEASDREGGDPGTGRYLNLSLSVMSPRLPPTPCPATPSPVAPPPSGHHHDTITCKK